MSTETTKKKIKIDNGTEFAKVYTDKQTDSKLTAKQDVLTAGTNITIKDNVISASGGSIAATALTNEDLDTLKTEGSYYAGGNNTCTNKPTGIDAFGLTIKRVASGYYTQYLTGGNTNTGQVYTRTFTSGAWTSWVKFTQDTQLSAYETKADITNKLKGYEKTLNLGTLTATGNSLLDILSTYFTDNNQCLLAFNSEGFIDTTTNLLSGSMVAFAQGDSDCYILSNGLIYKFNGTTATLISQDRLVSGTNIKSINGNSILGSGDLTISADKVFSIPIEQVITQEEIVELNALMTNVEGSVKVVFGSLYDFDDVFNNYDCLCLNCSTITGGEKDKIILRKNIDLNKSASFSCTYAYMYNGDLGAFSIINVTISKAAKTLTAERISSTDLLPTPESDTKDGDVLIYDSKRTKYGQLSKWATLDFYKTISLFGNHSILVPKDSTDTNIDLYNHAIEISGTTSGNYDYSIWFNVVSSKNLVVDSLTDLKTLLGNTFKREVFGFSNTSTTPTAIIGIDETQMYNTNGETTSFANLSSITFTDTVTTI